MLATIISKPARSGALDMVITDVGRKSISTTYGLPAVKSIAGELYSMPQEHSRIRLAAESMNVSVGDKIELWVKDANETFNLYDVIYAMRGDIVEAALEIYGRGRAT
jgi:D-serine deaminase-like pyridoxal phosphate-dependent protein